MIGDRRFMKLKPSSAMVLGTALLMLVAGCHDKPAGRGKPSTGASASSKPAQAPKPSAVSAPAARTRIETLLDVPKAIEPTGGTLPFSAGAEMHYPQGFQAQGGDDLGSALDTLTVVDEKAHCYITARLLGTGEPLEGVKLWASSAGGRPESFSGPEPIALGPDKLPAKLYYGKDGVKLGDPAGRGQGITIAIIPDANPKILVVGIARKDASVELRAKVAGCLQSFRLKK
jgi:hypothetical protein